MDDLSISKCAVSASTETGHSSFFKITSGFATFSYLVVQSYAALDHCQVITTSDSLTLNNVLI